MSGPNADACYHRFNLVDLPTTWVLLWKWDFDFLPFPGPILVILTYLYKISTPKKILIHLWNIILKVIGSRILLLCPCSTFFAALYPLEFFNTFFRLSKSHIWRSVQTCNYIHWPLAFCIQILPQIATQKRVEQWRFSNNNAVFTLTVQFLFLLLFCCSKIVY